MRLGAGRVFAEAATLWRGNRDLLVRIAAVFFFLPAFALQLFLAAPVLVDDAPPEEVRTLIVEWYAQNAHWIALSALVQLMGTGVVLVLLLDPARLRLEEALLRTLRLLPGLLMVWLGGMALFVLGIFAFILPGLYVLGRIFVTAATFVDRPERGPLAALTEGISRTRGNGWLLFAVTLLVNFATLLSVSVVDGIATAPAAGGIAGQALTLIGDAGSAAVTAAGALAMVLLQVAAFRLIKGAESVEPPRG